MRNLLRRWLGVQDYPNDHIIVLQKNVEMLIERNKKIDPQDLQMAVQVCGALVDYLDLDIKRDFVPDYSRLPVEQPMCEKIVVVKRNHKSK